MNPPTLSLAGRDEAFRKALRAGTLLFTYRKLRKIREISRSGGMNPPTLSLAGRNVAFGKALRARTLYFKKIYCKKSFWLFADVCQYAAVHV
jgi:hypothetical protein